MKLPLLLPALLIHISGLAQTKDFQAHYQDAKTAYQAKDYNTYYQSIAEAYKQYPYHQNILFHYGLACTLTNRPEEAVQFLRKAILINAAFDLHQPDLATLQNRDDFRALLKLKDQLNEPVIHSSRAFSISDRQLHLEGITYDSKTKAFFAGSIHKRKIIKINQDGLVSDFTQPGQDGMTSVFGLKVDEKKRWLWACASPMQEMENFDSTLTSRVFKYDLTTGKLLNSYTCNVRNAVLGDLILDPNGHVFISDSQNNIIFRVNESTHQLDKFLSSSEFLNIQGITFSGDGHALFIADYVKGIFRYDMTSQSLMLLACNLDTSLKGIDGLTWYGNSLIAVQNGIHPLRVTRYLLDKEGKEIVNRADIDRHHPDFNEPTNGTLAANSFYYIANSQWGGYENGKIKSADQLQDIVILKVALD